MKNRQTYQLNPLIEAQKSFDVMETRLFYLGLQDINPHISAKDKFYDKSFPDTIITPTELKKIFGHGQYISEVNKATDRLIGRYIVINTDDGFEKYTIFQHIKYKEGKGLFIKFNEDMRPLILEIYENYKNHGFTRIEMQQIFVLGSAYAMRILELLLQYRGKAKNGIIEREISVDELRYKLNVPATAYKGNMSNFRQRVLDSPINDINKNTKYNVSYKTKKSGRCVAGFVFTCNCNNAIKDDEYTTTIEAEPTPEERLEQEAGQVKLIEPEPPETAPAQAGRGLTDEQQEVYDRLVIRGISGDRAEKLVKEYNLVRIKRNLKKAVEQKDNAKNLAGYIISFIEQDAAGMEELEKKEAKAREEKRQKDRRLAYDDFHGTNMSDIGKARKAEEKEEKQEVKEPTELTELEVEMIKRKGEKAGKMTLKRMEKLGLTIEDVMAGKRKLDDSKRGNENDK